MKKRLITANVLKRLTMLVFILAIAGFSAIAQNISVTGSVKDANGELVPGVNIVVKGDNSRGTITDFDGNYSLSVSADAVLIYRFIGYQTQEVPVAGKTVINIKLEPETELIDDVVVVGYGSQKKKSVVGSITQAKGEELLQAGSVTTVSEALTGLLPGVTTMQAAGQPGSTSADILIRGRGSWTGSAPLYLVDGVERDFNNLDPNEIESISVLKDASATAVYGIKAANGVILVTTKAGKKGKAKVSFSMNIGVKSPTTPEDYAADPATNLEYMNLASMNDGRYDELHPEFYIDRWRDPAYADNPFYQYTSFINSLFSTARTEQYNLNISGGTDFVKYFTSVGYNYDGDIFDLSEQSEFDPRTYQKRFNWRTNLDFTLTKSTTFKVKLSGDMTNWNGNTMTVNTNNGITEAGGAIMSRIYTGVLIHAPVEFEDGRSGMDFNNPVNVNYQGIMENTGGYQRKSNRLYTDFEIKQDIGKHVTASAKFSYNYKRRYDNQIAKTFNADPVYYYIPSADGYNPDLDEDGNIIIKPDPGRLDVFERPPVLTNENIGASDSDNYYEFAVNYNQSFGSHDVSALGLMQRRKKIQGTRFPRLEEGWVGRVTYGYNDKYLFEANGAYNGNENFAPGKRFGFFPSVAVGWVMSEENLFKDNLQFIDFFKLKFTHGIIGSDGGLGNDDEDRFRYASVYGRNNVPMRYGYQPNTTLTYLIEGQPAVPDVTWETATKRNLGMELNVLNNRLQTSVDLFDEHREDILMQRRVIPTFYGNEAPFANIGETKNHGIDIELNWNDKIGGDMSYWVKANLSLSENRIVSRDDPATAPVHLQEAGKPIGWLSGLQDHGLYQNWDDVYMYPNSVLTNTLMPGDLRLNDYDADGEVTVADMVPIGNPSYATKSFAFSFGYSYKNLSLTVLMNGMFGISKPLSNNYLNPAVNASSLGFYLKNNEQKNAWTPLNTDTDVPILHRNETAHYRERNTYSVRDGSFVRLRNVELKYKFGKEIMDKTFFNSLEFYVNGNNLYTWQTLPNAIDPEQRVLEVYPITKRYNAGLRCSF